MSRASSRREASKTTQVRGSTEATCHGGCGRQGMHLPCKQGYAGVLLAISTSFIRELSRLAHCKSAVIKTSRKRDPWCITTNSHHSPYPRHGFRSQSRRGARLSTVSLAGASPAGTAMEAIRSFTSGTRKTSIRSAWNRETPGEAPGCPTTLPPRSSADPEPVTSNHVVAGANPAGEISQVSKQ